MTSCLRLSCACVQSAARTVAENSPARGRAEVPAAPVALDIALVFRVAGIPRRRTEAGIRDAEWPAVGAVTRGAIRCVGAEILRRRGVGVSIYDGCVARRGRLVVGASAERGDEQTTEAE